VPQPHAHIEEHELPSVEAVLAGTLALMTGYSQALQAELDPQRRVPMGEKISENLALLVQHSQLSLGFRQVLFGLQCRWQAMSDCTRSAARDLDDAKPARHTLAARHALPAPKRLQ
jgi:hypothetical protein